MVLRQLQISDSKTYLKPRQVTGNWAVGVVPILNEDVVLLKRKKQPYPEVYSIVTGKIEKWDLIDEKTDWWNLGLIQSCGDLEDPLNPAQNIEDWRITAIRELHEELYHKRKEVPSYIRNGNGETLNKLWHDFRYEMDVVDTTTGFLLMVSSAKLTDSKLNPIEELGMLSKTEVGQVNPFSQFVLYKLGWLKGTSTEIKYSQIPKVKGAYSWRERPNAYAIEY